MSRDSSLKKDSALAGLAMMLAKSRVRLYREKGSGLWLMPRGSARRQPAPLSQPTFWRVVTGARVQGVTIGGPDRPTAGTIATDRPQDARGGAGDPMQLARKFPILKGGTGRTGDIIALPRAGPFRTKR